MSESEKRPPAKRKWRSRWRWAAGAALVGVVAAAVLGIAVYRAQPTLRRSVMETLQAKFKSKVELDAFSVSLLRGLEVSGAGLRIFGETDPNRYEPGFQPIINVAEFRFHMGIRDLFHSPIHVETVSTKGLKLNLPPREHRSEMGTIAHQGSKIEIVVDEIVCDQAQLIINTLRSDKPPLEIDIGSLKMTRVGSGSPMHFVADLRNPKPVGHILSSGLFGPWRPDNPRDTPVSGSYSFDHADLGTINGLGGTLSSTGEYAGVLDKIVVDGITDTPDFRLAISGHAVPLHTEFHAIVDGTSGDTYLQPVKARLEKSWLVANGSVVRMKDPKGHRVELDVTMQNGKIDDLLKVAIRTDPPIMTGSVRLKTKLDLPPGKVDIANRLKMTGNFEVSEAHFANEKIQEKIDALSLRSQGQLKSSGGNGPDNVRSDLQGTFSLADGVLAFSQLHFTIPGTRVSLTGTYSLDGNLFDFHGTAQMDAKLSQMVGGWKSILLKPLDPLFSKSGVGTEIPVKISGTKSEPHFGVDFGHKDDTGTVGNK
ncbi:MAG: AsmA-like C-terminal region-containing protein [Terriglobales bacterium]|jgi:AsmA-like protein